ncbi:MAG TPA: response regulator [Candidatus Dormibacteraeota bacterium]|jgi:CheY-like chemotaxis protein
MAERATMLETLSEIAGIASDTTWFLRLTACPRCRGRRRLLADDEGRGLHGLCLGCGEGLPAPLATERLPAAGRRVLVVDGDPGMRALLARSLVSAGFRVHLARDGSEGLVRARQVCPDALVTEVRIPGLDGFEMCSRIRERRPPEALPIIVFSGLDPTPHRDAVVRLLGAVHVDKAAGTGAVVDALRARS